MTDIIKIKIKTRFRYKNQMDESDKNLYTEKEIESLLKDKYSLTLEEYYNIIVHNDKNFPHVCRNPECGKRLKFLGLSNGYHGTCNRQCADRYHSYHMVEITKTGVYKGTSHFLIYNKLESTKDLRRSQVEASKMDKNSTAFGSEYMSRYTNYSNILARYNYNKSVVRYLYLLEFSDKIKVGSTISIKRRIHNFGELPNPVFVIKGFLEEMARYEMEILRKFIKFTLRSDDGRFTEFLPKDKLNDVINAYESLLSSSTTIEKVTNIDNEN